MDNGYEQEPIGQDRVRFTVRPANVPRSRTGPLALAGIAGGLVVVGSGGPAEAMSVPHLVAGVLAAILVWGIAERIQRALEARRDRIRAPGGTFVASKSGIDRSGSRLPLEELAALTVRNPLLERRRRDRGVEALVRASYALCAGPPERPTVIAGGMSEAVALGLLEDVRRILDAGQRTTGVR
jgi:hypothetical protein